MRELDSKSRKRIISRLRSGQRLSPTDRNSYLPTPPRGVRLSNLGLDCRSHRSLTNAGYRDDPQRLGDLTVEEALAIKSFGFRCLERYLVASIQWEHNLATSDQVESDVISFLESVRAAIVDGNCDSVLASRLPDPPLGASVADLQISVRVRNCLDDLGVLGGERPLSAFTIGTLLGTWSFGITSLSNLVDALILAFSHAGASQMPRSLFESPPTEPENFVEQAVELIARVEELLDGAVVADTDPRFREILKAAGCASSLELVAQLRAPRVRRRDIENATRFILALADTFYSSLENEALATRGLIDKPKHAAICRAFFGFGDRDATTLQAVGKEFGISRERVRQICKSKRLTTAGHRAHLPVLLDVHESIRSRVPATSSEIESQIGLTCCVEKNTEVGEIIKYARSMNLDFGLSEVRLGKTRLTIHSSDVDSLKTIRRRIKSSIDQFGAITARRLASGISGKAKLDRIVDLATLVLKADDNLIGIGNDPIWITSWDVDESRYASRILEILQVSRGLTVGALRRALRRDYRKGPFTPPSNVLKTITELIPAIMISGDHLSCVELNNQSAEAAHSDEATIVEILRKHGGIMERRELQPAVIARGVGDANYWRHLIYSSMLENYGSGVYGIVGSSPEPGVVEQLATSRPKVCGGHKDRGWTNNGNYWMVHKLSNAAIETGIVGVPAGARPHLLASYDISNPSIESGTVTISNNNMWGFRKWLWNIGAEPGDYFGLLFDNRCGTVSIFVGDESLGDGLMSDSLQCV